MNKKSETKVISADETKLKELELARDIAQDCDYIPNEARIKSDPNIIENIRKYLCAKGTRTSTVLSICKKYAGKSRYELQQEVSELKIKINPEVALRLQDINAAARVASCFGGYCVSHKELKEQKPELYSKFLTEGITSKRIKAFCDEFSGNKTYEIKNYLDRV